MFKISPIQDKARQNEVLSLCGSFGKDGEFAYEMTDSDTGRLMGCAQFEITASGAVLSDLREADGPHDAEAMFILGRAILSFLDNIGVEQMRASAKACEERLLLQIGFVKEDAEFVAKIKDVFGHCTGKPITLEP